MKTAIIKTDFWKDDKIYDLSIDARLLYLCILTNPERNGTPAFKVSDRFLVSQTGFNINQIQVARKVLIDSELIDFIDGYYIINNQDYVEPKRGKLSSILYDKDLDALPDNIKELLLNRSRATQECIGISISSSISISKEEEPKKEVKKEKKTEENKNIVEVIDLFKNIDKTYTRHFKNKTERSACEELLKAYSLQDIEKRIKFVPEYNKLPYLGSAKIYKPSDLLRNWQRMEDEIITYQNTKKQKDNKYQII